MHINTKQNNNFVVLGPLQTLDHIPGQLTIRLLQISTEPDRSGLTSVSCLQVSNKGLKISHCTHKQYIVPLMCQLSSRSPYYVDLSIVTIILRHLVKLTLSCSAFYLMHSPLLYDCHRPVCSCTSLTFSPTLCSLQQSEESLPRSQPRRLQQQQRLQLGLRSPCPFSSPTLLLLHPHLGCPLQREPYQTRAGMARRTRREAGLYH